MFAVECYEEPKHSQRQFNPFELRNLNCSVTRRLGNHANPNKKQTTTTMCIHIANQMHTRQTNKQTNKKQTKQAQAQTTSNK